MPFELIAQGHGRRVRFWTSRPLKSRHTFCCCPDIPLKDEKRIKYLIEEYFLKKGEFPKKKEKFKHVEGSLFEIKSFQMRLLGFFANTSSAEGVFYEYNVVLCVKKQQDDLLPSDVKKGLRNIELCMQELQEGGKSG